MIPIFTAKADELVENFKKNYILFKKEKFIENIE